MCPFNYLTILSIFGFFDIISLPFHYLEHQILINRILRIEFNAMLQRLILNIIVIFFFTLKTESQIVASLNSTEVYIFPEATLQTDQYYSQTYPTDNITFAMFTSDSIWTLSQNNTVQILDKNDLTQKYMTDTEQSATFTFQSSDSLSMIVFDND